MKGQSAREHQELIEEHQRRVEELKRAGEVIEVTPGKITIKNDVGETISVRTK